MYARIGTFKIEPTKLDIATEYFRLDAVKAFSAHDAFLGYQSYIDRELGLMVGISRWASLEGLESSSESARNILAQASELGASLVGEPQILEQAFDERPIKLQDT